ncbi:DUF4244 domain-containing protein [Kribbella sp. DT2]|uniref:DUF4244 domain-containing protein n=1 Tax=Kribbella sp. DT2 TaxID=3393427 RepID=UPI003CE9A1EE
MSHQLVLRPSRAERLAAVRSRPHAQPRAFGLRRRTERGAATAEYAVATVAACSFGGILIALLKSDAMMSVLKAIINWALQSAGIEGVQV